MPSRTEPTGWIVRIIEVSAAGRRGSEIEISSQPSTCELSASSSSQPADGHAGTMSSAPSASAASSDATAATHVASNSGPAGRRRSSLPCRSVSRKPA
jgi:hypothetical protein